MILWSPEQTTQNHGPISKIFNTYKEKDAVNLFFTYFPVLLTIIKLPLLSIMLVYMCKSEQSVKLHLVIFETRKSVRHLGRGCHDWVEQFTVGVRVAWNKLSIPVTVAKRDKIRSHQATCRTPHRSCETRCNRTSVVCHTPALSPVNGRNSVHLVKSMMIKVSVYCTEGQHTQ